MTDWNVLQDTGQTAKVALAGVAANEGDGDNPDGTN